MIQKPNGSCAPSTVHLLLSVVFAGNKTAHSPPTRLQYRMTFPSNRGEAYRWFAPPCPTSITTFSNSFASFIINDWRVRRWDLESSSRGDKWREGRVCEEPHIWQVSWLLTPLPPKHQVFICFCLHVGRRNGLCCQPCLSFTAQCQATCQQAAGCSLCKRLLALKIEKLHTSKGIAGK